MASDNCHFFKSKMEGLKFLSVNKKSTIELFREIITRMLTEDPSPIDSLTPQQNEKLITTIKYLAGKTNEERITILSELECSDTEQVAQLIQSYASALETNQPIHQLVDFDWSASVILGTSSISNIKEPICTFKFDVKETVKGKSEINSHTIELTVEEAEKLLEQIEAARSSQASLLK